jgi:hypothetical protein
MQHTVQRDGDRDIEFDGELIAEAETSANNASPDYSGDTGRWTELQLYRTKAGKFVASCVSRTQWQGERDTHEAAVCENEADVVDFFGHGRLAKHIFGAAEISDAETVE